MRILSSEKMGAPAGCRGCQRGRFLGLNWRYREEPEPRHILESLERQSKLKWGYLHACTFCSGWWYLDEDESWVQPVPDHRSALLREWSELRLALPEGALSILGEIGATERDHYGNQRGRYRVPCSIEWADGSRSDPALVIIGKLPPIAPEEPNVALFAGVRSVAPTECALAPQVRVASLRAQELRMGFAPTLVEADGRRYVLNGATDLLTTADPPANRLALSAGYLSLSAVPPILAEDRARMAFVYADWFPEVSRMLILGSPRGDDAE